MLTDIYIFHWNRSLPLKICTTLLMYSGQKSLSLWKKCEVYFFKLLLFSYNLFSSFGHTYVYLDLNDVRGLIMYMYIIP